MIALKHRDDEEALLTFFQHNPFDDTLYLKQFVKKHPQNKMAWYLLGRDYMKKGKKSKAMYCFKRSGEIYEAFESQSLPLSPDQSDKRRSSSFNRNVSGLIKWTRTLIVLAIALFLVSVPLGTDGIVEGPVINPIEGDTPVRPYPDGARRMGSTNELYVLDVRQVWEARYGDVVASAQQTMLHDMCPCEYSGGDSSRLSSDGNQYIESVLVLRSAIYAYATTNGQLPETIDDLIRPYPDNMLAGYNPLMEELYPQSVQVVSDWLGHQEPAEEQRDEAVTQDHPDQQHPTYAEPLYVLVDKDNYRLAVMSGEMMIRSYPVGLGGDRTPEGEFEITSKVRHPNGKADGQFGSRGLVLSDTLYAIHGTPQLDSIGKDESLGCIRLSNEHIEELYDMVAPGTKVIIGQQSLPTSGIQRDQPFRLPAIADDEQPHKIYAWLN